MGTHVLQRYIIEAQLLKAELKALCGDDEQALIDSLEGASNLDEVMERLDGLLLKDEGLVVAIKKQAETLTTRKQRLEKRIEVQKALAKKALEVAGWRSRECAFGTYTQARKAACLGNLDEAKIPSTFWLDQDPKLDRSALLTALKAGEKIPGAELEPDGTILQVRRT